VLQYVTLTVTNETFIFGKDCHRQHKSVGYNYIAVHTEKQSDLLWFATMVSITSSKNFRSKCSLLLLPSFLFFSLQSVLLSTVLQPEYDTDVVPIAAKVRLNQDYNGTDTTELRRETVSGIFQGNGRVEVNASKTRVFSPNSSETVQMATNKEKSGLTKKSEPRVILHIGPHKTGTTAIQRFIHNYTIIELLSTDNIEIPTFEAFPGNNRVFPEYNFAGCMIENFRSDGGHMPHETCLKTLKPALATYLEGTYAKGKDILIVAEDMDRETIDLARIRTWLEPYTDIQIIVTYRRLHDWLKSW
jgi:hypothetical protein